MKKRCFIVFMALAVCYCAVGHPKNALAGVAVWSPGNNNLAFQMDLTPARHTECSLYMYKRGDMDNGLLLFQDRFFNSSTIYFTQAGDTWYAGLAADSKALNLGASSAFSLYFCDSINKYASYDINATRMGSILYDANTGMRIYTSANQVPIPASALLLCTGLIGLIGFRRRKG
ncbi:MAG: hypothetical protein VR64_11620 [Desulfatitalea sp. BRH_c12]|nr:MAG: hypothetical protein VR64_11620 [Desulfatitalea sp. BRH_c12]